MKRLYNSALTYVCKHEQGYVIVSFYIDLSGKSLSVFQDVHVCVCVLYVCDISSVMASTNVSSGKVITADTWYHLISATCVCVSPSINLSLTCVYVCLNVPKRFIKVFFLLCELKMLFCGVSALGSPAEWKDL